MHQPDSEVAAPRRRGAQAYLAASAAAQVFALVRYVLLARLLGPEQLGLASILIITASFFDMISDTGSDRFLIQDRDGDLPGAQKLVQLVHIVRGVCISAGLAILSGPIAAFYKSPQLAMGFAVLGLSSLTMGFLHMDMRRAQRHLDFRPEGWALFTAEGLSLAATAVAAILTHSYVAILFGLITRSIAIVAVSHITAKRRYEVGVSEEHWRRLAKFSMPLMLNGLLLFLGSQGDRVIVANQIGVEALGHYSAVLLLIFYPSATLVRFIHAMYLPLVAAERDNSERRDQVADRLGGQVLLCALLMSVGFVLVTPWMVPILYGHQFAMSVQMIALIGVLQASRFMIVWPTTVSLGLGRTTNVLASNIVRIIAYPAAIVGVLAFGGLGGILSGFLAGEAVALALALVVLNRQFGATPFRHFDRFMAFAAVSAAILGWGYVIQHWTWTAAGPLLGGSALLIAWIIHRESPTLRASIVMARSVLRLRRKP